MGLSDPILATLVRLPHRIIHPPELHMHPPHIQHVDQLIDAVADAGAGYGGGVGDGCCGEC